MKVFFLSDLHLDDASSAAAQRFLRFLRSEVKTGDVLLLGGDVFDLLVGPKRVFERRYGEVLAELKARAANGVAVHYLEGNHDFHFARLFEACPNFSVHTFDFSLSAFGRKIWVSHGDLIDPEDRGYRLLRAVTKNRAFEALVHALPESVVDFIGTRSSGASRRYTSAKVESAGTERLRRLYLGFAQEKVSEGFQHVLVGHSHLRDQVSIEGGGEYVNVGFSEQSLPYAVLEASSTSFSLREYP